MKLDRFLNDGLLSYARRASPLLLTTVLVASVSVQMAGCVPLMIAGVAATSYAASDRRTVGTQADDEVIQKRIAHRLKEELVGKAHVDVTSFNRKVLLTGEVPDQASKDLAERIAKTVDIVTGVVNELYVGPSASFQTRSSDTVITGRVKAQFVNTRDIFGNAYRVTTERGTVYLMGRVTPREGDRAAEVARSTPGVMEVVKVFDYITEDDLRRMRTQPAGSSTAPAEAPARSTPAQPVDEPAVASPVRDPESPQVIPNSPH